MKILLAGLGSFGMQVASTLVEHGHDLVLMDRNPDTVRDAGSRLDCMTLTGRANNPADLERAGLKDCGVFIAMTGSDEINLISSAQASAMQPAIRTIARVRSNEYDQLRQVQGGRTQHLINPDISAALGVLNSLVYGAVSDVITLHTVDIQIRTLAVPVGSRLHDRTLMQVSQSLPRPCLVPLINRQDTWLVPAGDTLIQEGDLLYLAARGADFAAIFETLGKNQETLRHVLILGGSRVGTAVAAWLSGDSDNLPGGADVDLPGLRHIFGRGRVTLLESDYVRCKELSEQLHHALVVHGDIGDEALFREENLGRNDVIVCCTDVEERNILAGLYGKRMGIKRSISLVQSHNYLSIARQLELDVAVSLRTAVANSIIRILQTGEAESVHSLGAGTVEIFEYVLDPGCKADGLAIMKLGFPPETLIMGVHRDGESFIARGPTVLQAGDRVVVLSRHFHAERVEALFKAENGENQHGQSGHDAGPEGNRPSR